MRLKKDYIIPLLAIIVITILFILGPIKQNPQYHLFADQRQGWGIPNFLNVITNLPFFIVGILGLHEVTKTSEKVLKLIFNFLFIGFLLLTIGSSYYHLSPNNQTLVYDRIPIAIIIMSFFAFIVYDYMDNKKGLLAFLVFNFLGVLSVLYWALGDKEGNGDLRWYGFTQFFPVIAIPIILYLYRSSYNLNKTIILIFLLFGFAKLSEKFDSQIFNVLHKSISGHSLKHIFMAIAGYEIVLLVKEKLKSTV
jgi:hypothetical protein